MILRKFKVQSKMICWKKILSWPLTRWITITTIFRSVLLLRNFLINDQHIVRIWFWFLCCYCVIANKFFDVRNVIDIWRCLLHQVLSTTTATLLVVYTYCSFPKTCFIKRTCWLATGEPLNRSLWLLWPCSLLYLSHS